MRPPASASVPFDVTQFAKAVRFALVGLSYFPLRCALSIDNFQALFSAKLAFLAISIAVPVRSMASLLFRNLLSSL